jgi:hypothetical protein
VFWEVFREGGWLAVRAGLKDTAQARCPTCTRVPPQALQAASAPLKLALLALKRYTRPLADEVYSASMGGGGGTGGSILGGGGGAGPAKVEALPPFNDRPAKTSKDDQIPLSPQLSGGSGTDMTLPPLGRVKPAWLFRNTVRDLPPCPPHPPYILQTNMWASSQFWSDQPHTLS